MAFKKYRNFQGYQYSNESAGNSCGCVDACGKPKKHYRSYQEAKNAQEFVWSNNGVEVEIYDCPSGKGYHLTSHKN